MTSPSAPSGGISVALGGAFAIAAGIGIGRFIYTPILPPMIEALSLSKANAGLPSSVTFLRPPALSCACENIGPTRLAAPRPTRVLPPLP
jgi:hypothetical protein